MPRRSVIEALRQRGEFVIGKAALHGQQASARPQQMAADLDDLRKGTEGAGA